MAKLIKRTKVTKTVKNRDGQMEEVVKKDSTPVDHADRHFSNFPCVGISKGVTLNMGDYESLRVDVWLSVPLTSPDPNFIKITCRELANTIDEIIDEETEKDMN